MAYVYEVAFYYTNNSHFAFAAEVELREWDNPAQALNEAERDHAFHEGRPVFAGSVHMLPGQRKE